MLLKKVVGRSRFYDLLHRGWVNTCVAVSVFSIIGLGIGNFYAYMDSNKGKESVNKEAITDLAGVTQKEGELS